MAEAEVERVVVAVESNIDRFLAQIRGGFRQAENAASSTASSMSETLEQSLRQGGTEAGEQFTRAIRGSAYDSEKALKAAMKAASDAARQDALRAAQAAGQSMEEAFRRARAAGEEASRQAFASFDDEAARAAHEAQQALQNGLGPQTGQGLGQGVGGGITDGVSTEMSGAGGKLTKAFKVGAAGIALAAAAIGTAAGAALVGGLQEAIEQEKSSDRVVAALGLTPDQARLAGKVAGNLYKGAYADSLDDANRSLETVLASLPKMRHATEEEVQAVTASLLDFQAIYGYSAEETMSALGVAVQSGLIDNTKKGFDFLFASMQKVSPLARDEILAAITEYSPFLKDMGYDAKTAFALLQNGAARGAYGVDKSLDAIKEFGLKVKNLDTSAKDGVKALGLDMEELAFGFGKGGDAAGDAAQKIAAALLDVEDRQKRFALAAGIIGTPFEDIGDRAAQTNFLKIIAQPEIDESQFAGAADKAGKVFNDNAATRIQEFKNTLKQNFVEFIGNEILPVIDRWSKKLMPFVDWLKEVWKEIEPDVRETGAAFSDLLEEFGRFWDKYGEDITAAIIFMIRAQLRMFRIIAVTLQVLTVIITNFTRFFSAGWERLWTGVANFFVAVWNGITGFFSSVAEGIASRFRRFVETVQGIISWFTGLPQYFFDLGRNVIQGFINGVRSLGDSIWDAVSNPFESVYDGARSFFKMASPSKLMRKEIGQNIMLGVTEGIKDYKFKPAEAMREANQALLSAAKESSNLMPSNTVTEIQEQVAGGGNSSEPIAFHFHDHKDTPEKVLEALSFLTAYRTLHAGA